MQNPFPVPIHTAKAAIIHHHPERLTSNASLRCQSSLGACLLVLALVTKLDADDAVGLKLPSPVASMGSDNAGFRKLKEVKARLVAVVQNNQHVPNLGSFQSGIGAIFG